MADEECRHPKVTIYSRLVCMETWDEPAEYEFKIICDECGEEFEETPEGAQVTEAEWAEDYYEDL